jgi:hypothetical protein
MKYLPYAFALSFGIFIGSIIGDVPFLSIETRIRPFEAATFLLITTFGYWYQSNQKAIDKHFSTHHKIIENCIMEGCDQINKIISRIETNLDSEISDQDKKILHQEIRNLAVNIDFIENKTQQKSLTESYMYFKDKIANDDFSTSKFTINSNYFRDASNSANKLKIDLKDSMYKVI